MTNLKKRFVLAIAGVAAAAVATAPLTIPVLTNTPAYAQDVAAPAAATAPIEFTVTNESGKGDMYVSAIGTVGEGSTTEGYLNESGELIPWGDANSPTPVDAPDATMFILKEGESKTFTMPYWFSGRVYYSFGEAMPFKYVQTVDGRTGTVQPVPWNTDDPSSQIDYDSAEMTYSEWGLYLNSTQVDMVANPAVVTGTGAEGTEQVGGITEGGFQKIVDTLADDPIFSQGIQKDENGEVIRVIAPTHYVENSEETRTYLDPYINNVWDKYTNEILTIVPDPTNNPDLKFTGKVEGDNFVFTGSDGSTVTIPKPTTSNVWGCDGTLNAAPDPENTVNKDARGMVARSLCADFHRGTLGSQETSPATDPSTFYQTTDINEGLFNHYSAAVHANMPNGQAYGFAFDDVGGFESLVHVTSPTEASITVVNRETGVGAPDPDPSATPEPSVTPDPTDTPSATPEPTDTPSATPDPTDDPSATPEPTTDETPSPNPFPTPTNTPPAPEDLPSAHPGPVEDDPTATPTPDVTGTPTPDVTDTPTPTPTPTDEQKPSESPVPTPTATPTPVEDDKEKPGITTGGDPGQGNDAALFGLGALGVAGLAGAGVVARNRMKTSEEAADSAE